MDTSGSNLETPLPELDGYDLVDELGRGGMGVVYEAFQRSTGRRVAVKFMLDSAAAHEDARRRFEREVELVARLQHPHIVPVVDSGIYRGSYYYVLDYIDGVALNRHLDAGACEVRTGLSLIAAICEAVDYAHQRGVLHRDLKPSNILIDRRGDPHILDFGLAKAIEPDSRRAFDNTLSKPGEVIGTLAYMSPEQSRGQFHQLSVRSDVYALGAIAYELLTGQLPCPIDGPLNEVFRGIAERDPPRPSTIRGSLGADIDAILLKTLDKDPQRRYATAGELAADIHRWLKGEPILARPPSPALRLTKWIRRNRARTIVIILSCAVIPAIVWVSFVRIMRERDSSRAQAMFYSRTLKTLDMRDGTNVPALVASMVENARNDLNVSLATHPEQQAEAQVTLGNMLVMLERFDEALTLFDRARIIREQLFGPTSAQVAEAMLHQAEAKYWLARQSGGDEQRRLYEESRDLYERTWNIRRSKFGSQSREVAECMHGVAAVYREMGELTRAEELFKQALELRQRVAGIEEWEIAATRHGLGRLYLREDRLELARVLFNDALATLRQMPDEKKKPLFEARTLQSLAECTQRTGDLAEAEQLFRDALAIEEAWAEAHSPTIAHTLVGLAEVLVARSMHSEADRSQNLLEAEKACERVQGCNAASVDLLRAAELLQQIREATPAESRPEEVPSR